MLSCAVLKLVNKLNAIIEISVKVESSKPFWVLLKEFLDPFDFCFGC